MKERNLLRINNELAYVFALCMQAFGVALISAANVGVSMVIAPALLFSQKFTFLTFGQCEYIVQGLLLIAFCITVRKFKWAYLSSFMSCLIYATFLDMWRALIPLLNPVVTPPETLALGSRIVMFVCAVLIIEFSLAILNRTYFYPVLYDFFVRGITQRFKLNFVKVKTTYDMCSLAVSLILSLVFFGRIAAIGVGTIIMACINGYNINKIGQLLDKVCVLEPAAKKFSKHFDLTNI